MKNGRVMICEWFALCTNPAAGTVTHPILGEVPTCERCATMLDLKFTNKGRLTTMSDQKVLTEYTTKDTGEVIHAEAPHGRNDARGYSLDGYDWIDAAETTGWYALSNWGKDGWDAGQWPYVIVALAKGQDEVGPFFGMTTYCEGDLETTFYRSQEQQWEAITEWCRWNWLHGQGDGPKLESPVGPADRETYGRPYGDEYDNRRQS